MSFKNFNAEVAEDTENAEEKTMMTGNTITEIIIGKAIEVHQEIGPGLLESVYETCLAYELSQSGLQVERQKQLPITYKTLVIGCAYRLDLFVEDTVIVEIKSVDHIEPVHKAQLLSYLRLADVRLGLLINFNVSLLKQGIRRIVNEF